MNKVPLTPAGSATINVLGPIGLGVTTAVGVGVGSVDFEVGPIDLEVRIIAVEMLGKNTITVNRNNDSLFYLVDLVMLNKHITVKDAKKIYSKRLEEMMAIPIYLPSS